MLTMMHRPAGSCVLICAAQIKIGRQTNIKTVPGERNAYFDSKVLSRTHAEIWEQNGKVSPFSSSSRHERLSKYLFSEGLYQRFEVF